MTSRIVPIFSFFIGIAIFFVYVQPVWSGPVADAKAEIAAKEQTLIAARGYKQKQNQLAEARNAIDAEKLGKLETFLPDSVDNVGLILDINALAARSGISLSSIDIASTVGSAPANDPSLARPDPVGSVDLSLSAVGTYAALHTFLEGIEKSARLLDTQEIVVKGSETGVYGYSMNIRLYWLR